MYRESPLTPCYYVAISKHKYIANKMVGVMYETVLPGWFKVIWQDGTQSTIQFKDVKLFTKLRLRNQSWDRAL